MTSTDLPRVMLAAPASGHGKTTLTVGLLAALRARGEEVAPFKVGPDYIDPGYHALATGRPGRNLDPFLTSEDLLVPLMLHGARTPRPADVAVVEGVMGLFDGRLGTGGFGSAAHVARLTQTPVVLVVDTSHTSRSIAALVHGFATFDPATRVAGVILNKVGSVRHEAEVVSALEATGVPVLGVLPRNADFAVPERHLGLVPAEERGEAAAGIDALAAHVAERVDLDAVLALARTAPPLVGRPWDPAAVVHAPDAGDRPVVAVAGGRAFTFRYAETTELLAAAGCDPVVFDPTTDPLPEGAAGLYLGGGFPQVHAADLGANRDLLAQLRDAIGAGLPTVAECAGLLYLTRVLDETPLVGAVPATSAMGPRLTMGYRTAIAPADTLLARAGERVTGHEFHRTQVTADDELAPAWLLDGKADGFAAANVHASYLHTHWAGHPHLAQRFADAVHAYHSGGPFCGAPTSKNTIDTPGETR